MGRQVKKFHQHFKIEVKKRRIRNVCLQLMEMKGRLRQGWANFGKVRLDKVRLGNLRNVYEI